MRRADARGTKAAGRLRGPPLAALFAGALAIGGGPDGAPADAAEVGPRLVVDRAELEPSWFDGLARLRLFVTAVVLEGGVIPLGAGDDLALAVGGSARREPALIGRFAGRDDPLALALVVEVGWAYHDELGVVGEALARLMGGLPERAQVTLVTYGEDSEGGHRFESPSHIGRRLAGLDADGSPGDPALIEAVNRAIAAVGKLPAGEGAPLRRVVVVVSDGVDADPEPARYRAAGAAAARQGVRIHSLAYSPTDSRRPLLGLGELSRRSGGTFRWVRSREGFATQIDTLIDELGRQYVVTFFVPPDEVAGQRVGLRFKELASNEVKLDEPACGAARCEADEYCAARRCLERPSGGRGILGTLGWIAAVVGGVLIAGAIISAIAQHRGVRTPPGAVAPADPGSPVGIPARAAPAGSPARVVAPNRMAPVVPGQGGPAPAAGVPTAARPGAVVHAGRTLPLRHGFTVGTAASCDLAIKDPHVSAQHAQFVLDVAGNWVILDRGSSNGTFVNGVRIRDVRLTHGVAIRLGQTELRFLLQ